MIDESSYILVLNNVIFFVCMLVLDQNIELYFECRSFHLVLHSFHLSFQDVHCKLILLTFCNFSTHFHSWLQALQFLPTCWYLNRWTQLNCRISDVRIMWHKELWVLSSLSSQIETKRRVIYYTHMIPCLWFDNICGVWNWHLINRFNRDRWSNYGWWKSKWLLMFHIYWALHKDA